MKHSKELQIIFDVIKKANAEARFVGGAVRDFLLNQKPIESGDVDLAVNLPVHEVAEIFRKIKAKVITKYATNIVVLNGRVFEITSTRRDENCDGRYAKMIFTPSFEEDSNRRDFTINALYMDEAGKIFDFHNGITDLNSRIVRFIGNPEFRIEEDYLRIWRFFRFSCLYGKEINEEGFLACKSKKGGLSLISKERVTAEMLKLLKGSEEKIKFTLGNMIEANILSKEEFNLNLSLPEDAFERLVVLNNGGFGSNFLYTVKQKRIINLNLAVRSKLNDKVEILFLFYKLKQEDFESILRISNIKMDFVPKNLTLKIEDVINDGFKNAEISKEFERRLFEFCKSQF